jgi:hypothetical protein
MQLYFVIQSNSLTRLAGGIILRLTYGYEVQDGEDPFVNLIEHANDNFNAATVPGAFPVDFFPSMRKLPQWLPGMGFIKLAAEWAKDTARMVEVPYNYTKEQMVFSFLGHFHGKLIYSFRPLVQRFRPLSQRVLRMRVHYLPMKSGT